MTTSPRSLRIQFATFFTLMLVTQLSFAMLLCALLPSVPPVARAAVVLFCIGAAIHTAVTTSPDARPEFFRALMRALERHLLERL